MSGCAVSKGADPRKAFAVPEEILSRSASHRLIGQALELEEEWIPEAHVTLGHQHSGGIGLRADPPMGARKTAPLELAGRIRGIERRWREGDGAAKTKALTGDRPEIGEAN